MLANVGDAAVTSCIMDRKGEMLAPCGNPLGLYQLSFVFLPFKWSIGLYTGAGVSITKFHDWVIQAFRCSG
jgi:hypothetical protein